MQIEFTLPNFSGIRKKLQKNHTANTSLEIAKNLPWGKILGFLSLILPLIIGLNVIPDAFEAISSISPSSGQNVSSAEQALAPVSAILPLVMVIGLLMVTMIRMFLGTGGEF